MNRSRKLTLALCLFTSAAAFAASAGAVSARAKEAEKEFALQEYYVSGQTLSTEGATVQVGGKDVAAQAVLYRPDGVASTGNSFRLDSAGKYTLELFADHAGSRTSVRKSFIVGESVCTFTDERSSYEFTPSGLNVSLKEGSKLTVNQTVDITGITADEEIVTIAVTPSVAGQADFTKIRVTVTDEANSDCYVKLLLQASPTTPAASYGLAGGTNQALTGYEKEWDRIHKNNEWGTYMPFTFYGSEGASSEFGLRYDSVTKKVYALEGREIIDLDEKKYFPNAFKGFESGRVRVSVECLSYLKDTAHFTVKKLRGASIEKTFIADETAPVLSVENGNACAVVGRAFPLYNATAMDDVAGAVPVTKRVWRNFGMSNAYLVDCPDGAFTPSETGIYTIEYTAKDLFGNVTRVPVEVQAVEKAEEIRLTLGSGATEGTLGMPCSVRSLEATGGSGALSVRTVAVLNGEETELEDGLFVPEKAGDYEIVYTVTDYVGNTATEKYTFRATPGTEPIFGTEPVLPRYILADGSYTFGTVAVRDYTSGSRVDGECEVYLEQGGNSRKIQAGTPVTMEFGEGELTVIYRYKSKDIRRTVPVIQVKEDGKLNLGKYFSGKNIQISVTAAGTLIEGGQSSSAVFIRELLAEGLSATFNVGNSGMRALKVRLTDYADSSETILIGLAQRGNGHTMSVNGRELCTDTKIGFTQNSASNEFALRYEAGALSCDGITFYPVTDAVPAFKGFSSGRVYLEFIFDDADSGSTLTVKNVNRQPVNTVNTDRIPPRIVVAGEYGGEKQIGEEVTLGGADALDVIDTRLTFTLTVKDPDGNYVVDLGGTVLNKADARGTYRFKIEKYGNYRVSYAAKDGTGFQDGVLNYVISVQDKSAPEIVFKGTLKEQYKISEKVTLPAFEVTDNCSGAEDLTVYRYITTPSGRLVLLADDVNAVSGIEEGVYLYTVVVYDKAGNMGIGKIAFRVTDERGK